MRKKIFITLIILFFVSTIHGSPSIPTQQRFILKETAPSYGIGTFEGRWMPTEAQCDEALMSVIGYLNGKNTKGQYDEVHLILENIEKYGVQFVGVIRDNEKRIFCNFFGFKGWEKHDLETHFVFVFDGGFWYWSIEYGMVEKKCDFFMVNGYA